MHTVLAEVGGIGFAFLSVLIVVLLAEAWLSRKKPEKNEGSRWAIQFVFSLWLWSLLALAFSPASP
jgi:hypothetical protein